MTRLAVPGARPASLHTLTTEVPDDGDGWPQWRRCRPTHGCSGGRDLRPGCLSRTCRTGPRCPSD